MTTKIAKAKPFLKWAGGKTQLLSQFQKLYPKELFASEITTFHEPFLGSGAVFFDIAQQFQLDSAYLYDINEDLILVYRVVQQDVEKLLHYLYRHERDYLKLNSEKRQQYFYEQRTSFNLQRVGMDYEKYSEKWILRAAQIIFLNRTCFNGLYRVNSKGDFNTPSGKYVNPTICDEENLNAANKLLSIAEIKKADFKELGTHINSKSFVYFDPPYRPISKTSSFKAYSNHNFDDKQQQDLAKVFIQLNTQGAKLMLSNSDPKNHEPDDNFFDDLYSDFMIQRIQAKRMINSNAAKRGAVSELVITNY